MPALRRFNFAPVSSSIIAVALLCSPLAALPASAAGNAASELPFDAGTEPGPEVVLPPETAMETQPERIIVKFRDAVRNSASQRNKAYGKAGQAEGVSVDELGTTGSGATVVEVSEDLTATEAEQVAAALEAQAEVEYAEVDIFLRPATTPNDTYYPYQWDLHEELAGMQVPGAWVRSTGAGTVVAVIDTGITAHSDLAPNLVPGYDFISDSSIAGDGDGRDSDNTDVGDSCQGSTSSWHGTHVAGTIGAYTDTSSNGTSNAGIVGVAYGAKIQPIRALGACGGYLSDVADAVTWAVGGPIAGLPVNPTPAAVVNLSLGGKASCSAYFQNALNVAATKNAVVVAAAGNSNASVAEATPANCEKIVTVGATGREGSRAGYSNYGPAVDVSAPGGDFVTGGSSGILSTHNNGSISVGAENYAYMQGTSMAAPHVAGAVALMRSAAPSMTAAQVEETLKSTARPLPGSCATGGCGAGLVDAAAATQAASPEPVPFTSAPVPSIGFAAVGRVLDAQIFAEKWSPEPESFSYQWLRNDVAIPGATTASYTPVEADQGASVNLAVTASKRDYKTTTAASNSRTVAERANTPAPIIQGRPQVDGSTLTAADVSASWTPGPATVQYQWLRDQEPIAGATSTSYTPVPADVGMNLRLKASGEGPNMGYTEVLSDPTAAVAPGTLTSPTPQISGMSTVGQVLQAMAGTWTEGTTLGYQWLREGMPITGATQSAYTLTADDHGKTIAARVTGSKTGYTTAVVNSEQTAPIGTGTFTPPSPQISGEATVGVKLLAVAGNWGEGTALSYQWLRNGTAISNAGAASYTLIFEDLNKTISVRVTGTRSGFTTQSAESAPTATVQNGSLQAPVPTVAGTAKVGTALSAVTGAWTPDTVLRYQWYSSGVAVVGATATSYTPSPAQLGKALTVRVTGTKAGYSTSVRESAATGAVAAGTLQAAIPAISGTTRVGFALTVLPGTWTSGTTLRYQWYRSGVAITGATASRYTLGSADVGKGIRVRVTGTKAGYITLARDSAQTGAVLAGNLSAPVPGISGTKKVGYTLAALPGTWTSGTTLRYQWYRSGVAITGATASRYILGSADLGKSMKVRVTGSKAGYTTIARFSGPTAAVVAGTLSGATPSITGTTRAGYVLTANPGTWTSGTTLRYQWYRSGVAITGATGQQYRLVAADRYDTLKVRVIGSKPGYTSLARYSWSTARIP